MIGNLYRPGTLYTQGVVETLDYDFPSLAQGVIIPHGIYDLKKNQGYINLGTSHDTSEFACDSLRQWSTYNPIEHRLFPHLQRACQGVIFTSVEVVKELMEKATTKTGLQVSVHILTKVYTTGRKVAVDFKEQMRGLFDEELPHWNYRVLPEAASTG